MVLQTIHRLFNKLPMGQNGKVFVGTSAICVLCAIPLMRKERPKPGHGLFDSEKPQEVELAQEAARKQAM
ncbi:unnamed protein product, partial [Choristocarpus tenellus]